MVPVMTVVRYWPYGWNMARGTVLREKIPQGYFVYHKSHIDWPGSESDWLAANGHQHQRSECGELYLHSPVRVKGVVLNYAVQNVKLDLQV